MSVKKKYRVTLYLDTRRIKESKKYPVRLRLYFSASRKVRYYNTVFDFSEKEFQQKWLRPNPLTKDKEHRSQLQSIYNRAVEILEGMPVLSFDEFENQYFEKKSDYKYLKDLYDYKIKELNDAEKIGTCNSYRDSYKSIAAFIDIKGGNPESFLIQEITVRWLKSYEKFMLDNGRSVATVGIYLRALRAIYNIAISKGEASKDSYPFGKKKYVIKNSSSVNKSFDMDEVKLLLSAPTASTNERKARDFFILSYLCNGMNTKDIVNLRVKNLDGDKLIFNRQKTSGSQRIRKSVIVYLIDESKSIIERYRTGKRANDYLFDILSSDDDAQARYNKSKNFVRYINQHLKPFAVRIGLPSDISTYYARHSFANVSLNNNINKSQIQEALGHQSMATTENYLSGFSDDAKRKMNESLL